MKNIQPLCMTSSILSCVGVSMQSSSKLIVERNVCKIPSDERIVNLKIRAFLDTSRVYFW